jgi:hypothetical protein
VTAARPAAEKAARDGVARIAAERRRQIEVEGYARDWDMGYNAEQLSRAAAAYLCHATFGLPVGHTLWPWDRELFKPSPRDDDDSGYWTAANIAARTRDLTRAGALIAAEIDRLQALTLDGNR